MTLIIDIDFNQMQSMITRHGGNKFILEKETILELYVPTDEGIIFRSVYPRGTPEQDMLFFEKHQGLSRINSIEKVGQTNDTSIMINILTILNSIREELRSLNDTTKQSGR